MLEYRIPLHSDDALDSLDDHLNRKRIPPLQGNDNIWYLFRIWPSVWSSCWPQAALGHFLGFLPGLSYAETISQVWFLLMMGWSNCCTWGHFLFNWILITSGEWNISCPFFSVIEPGFSVEDGYMTSHFSEPEFR